MPIEPERRDMRKLLRAPTGAVDLAAIEPKSTPGLPDEADDDPKSWAREQVTAIGEHLSELQERLYAESKGGGRRRFLLVLQAMDCGGKDGTVRKVAGTMNPQGLRVVAFGAPTQSELKHPFLWRIRRALPSAGLIGVFNRSHYEDVLIVKVHGLVPANVLAARYDEINRFEAEQAREGLTILKVMLHISRNEQAKRLASRLADPTKRWKYNPADLAERARWDDYHAAYETALARCNSDDAPWYVVPADRKWYRDWAVANLLWETLDDLEPHYPKPDFDPSEELRKLAATT
jgi:PPK2 family polyphosphate:nucleotide phosphotransferase